MSSTLRTPQQLMQVKKEIVYAAAKVIERWAGGIVLRHPFEESGRYATEAIINAGDGSNQYPTQTRRFIYLAGITRPP